MFFFVFFSRFLLLKLLNGASTSFQLNAGRSLLRRGLISFLVSCPNREPQEKSVWRSERHGPIPVKSQGHRDAATPLLGLNVPGRG